MFLACFYCSGALDKESLIELCSQLGTVIDDPQEEKAENEDE